MKPTRWLGPAAILLSIAVAACAPAPVPPPPPPPPPMAAPPAPPSLYQRLGGQQAITAVVDDFVANVAKDKRINRYFRKTDIPHLKMALVDQICQVTGGPCTYTGPSMREVHHNMKVTNKAFDALVENLVKTLNKFNVPQPE